MSAEPLLTLLEAGRLLGVGSEQVRRFVARGDLVSRRAGAHGRHLVRRSDVQALLGARPSTPPVSSLARRVGELEATVERLALVVNGLLHQEEETDSALKAENLRLKDSESRLALAAEAERDASALLRAALAAQREANRLSEESSVASSRASEAYFEVLRTYRLDDDTRTLD
jgi:hypothetical protein